MGDPQNPGCNGHKKGKRIKIGGRLAYRERIDVMKSARCVCKGFSAAIALKVLEDVRGVEDRASRFALEPDEAEELASLDNIKVRRHLVQ